MLHLTTFLLATLVPSAAELKAGAAEVEITPPPGYRMSGYFHERLNTGTHDPLHAKALFLEQGEQRAALVFCDLIGVPAEVVAHARQMIEQQSHVPGDHVLVAATHSHTGPLYYDVLREHFHRLAVEKHGRDPQEPFDYAEQLAEKIAAAVQQARAATRPVRLAAGVAQQTGLSFNRRFHMKNGKVVFNPGRLNPDIIRPAGPIDPDVGLLLARDVASEQPLALLTVFALHLDTVGGTDYSADYPYYLERTLRRRLGKNESLVSLFGAGTCGDINHIDVSTQRPPGNRPESERIGSRLAETVLENVDRLTPVADVDLAVRTQTIDVPLQRYSPEQVETARRNMAKIGGKELSFLDQVEACKIVAVELRGKPSLPLEVQVFRFDRDVALVALPGEVFVDLGLEIKRRSPFRTTFVVELANDNPHYVPTRKAFAEGSYEVVNSLVETGGGERLVEAAVKLLEELKPADTAAEKKMSLHKQAFGKTAQGQPVEQYTLANGRGVTVKIITYGAIITSVETPDRTGKPGEITLGFDTLEPYLAGHPFFGAICGRVANRIAQGKFTIDGHTYHLAKNNGPNHLHGGNVGFDKAVWNAEPFTQSGSVGVRMTHRSPDGDEGYPGNLALRVVYSLTGDGELKIDYTATTDKATPINLTNHTYWNLADGGASDVLDHVLTLNASRFLPVDDTLIPTGELKSVAGGPMNFTKPVKIGARLNDVPGEPKGYDHCFVLDKTADDALGLAARVEEPHSGRVMEMYTTEPAVQLYTANFLDGTIHSRGAAYGRHHAFCLEAEHFPDAVNQPSFRSTVLRPGETYRQTTVYKFRGQ